MAQQTINVGTSPNDGTGTPLRTAFQYTNSNFSELYTAVGPSGNNIVVPGTATISGDLTVDTSTLKVDSANNRVGVNTATPRASFALDVLGNVALGNSTTTTSNRLKLDCLGTAGNVAVMSFAAAGTSKAFYGLSGGYLGDASTDAMIATDAAGAAIRFYTSDTGVESGRFNSTGNLVLKGGTVGANGVGVTFAAAQVASSDANCLDDYEEGVWTPTGSSAVNCTSVSVVAARYTKIGRIVTLSGNVTASVTVANTLTYVTLTGLPFNNAAVVSGSCFENNILAVGFSDVESNNAYLFFPATSELTTGSKSFFFEVTYHV